MMSGQKNNPENHETVMTQQITHDGEKTNTQENIGKNKTMAGLPYLLFFLPLITCPESGMTNFMQTSRWCF